MKKRLLLAALALVMGVGVASCGEDPAPAPAPEEIAPHAFTAAAADMFKEQLESGKFVLTCVGYEGMNTVKGWIDDFGYTSVDAEDPTTVSGEKEYAASKKMDLSKIPSDYLIICGVGYTGKGLSDAGTSKQAEIDRATTLAAKECAGLLLIGIDGKANRGTVADQLWSKLLPVADAVVAKTSVDEGEFITSALATYTTLEFFSEKKAADIKTGLQSLGF